MKNKRTPTTILSFLNTTVLQWGGPGVDAPDEEASDEPADDLARAIADAQRNNISQREWLKLERMLEDHKKNCTHVSKMTIKSWVPRWIC